MIRFSSLNKKYNLKIEDDCLYGDLLSSITKESVLRLVDCVYNYCSDNYILQLNIGYDANSWSKIVVNDFIIPRLRELSFNTLVVDKPCPLFQVSWLNSQSKKRCLGLYVGRDSHRDTRLGFYFRNYSGNPFSEKDIKKLLKSYVDIKTYTIKGIIDSPITTIDISEYIKYLIDNKYLSDLHKSKKVSIDLMFGSGENLISELKKQMPNINTYNHASEFRRFLYYLPKTTGNTLKMWVTDAVSNEVGSYFFALDGDSDCLGLYDLKQNLEISPSGVYLLLLHYLKYIKKIDEGTVLISKCLNKRVSKYARKLKYKVKLIDKLSDINKYDNVLVYGDEYGGFWINDTVKDRNPLITLLTIIEVCEFYKKSPGELLDEIHETLKINCYYHNIYIDSVVLTKSQVSAKIKTSSINELIKHIKSGYTDEYKLTDGTRIIVFENKKLETTEIYIESKNLETIKQITDSINTLI